MSCAAPVAFETLVAYWAGDLDRLAAEAVEEHLFDCAACTASAERVASVTERIRGTLPPVVTRAVVDSLRARGHRIDDNVVTPGSRSRVVFDKQDFIIHHLSGLALHDVESVGVTVRVVETGVVLLAVPNAPFERETGEVLIACQRHFAAFPPNVRFVVESIPKSGPPRLAEYVVEHDMRSSIL